MEFSVEGRDGGRYLVWKRGHFSKENPTRYREKVFREECMWDKSNSETTKGNFFIRDDATTKMTGKCALFFAAAFAS